MFNNLCYLLNSIISVDIVWHWSSDNHWIQTNNCRNCVHHRLLVWFVLLDL